GKHPQVAAIFSKHALAVCEGQQLDMEYERREQVSVSEYRAMIRLKTAMLLAGSLQIGACLAGAGAVDQERIAAFGEHLGLAFQLRDDLLDAFGDPAATGKQQGGDLRAGKKTFLLIRGLELGEAHGRRELQDELAKPGEGRDVPRMLKVLEELGVRTEAERTVQQEEEWAMNALGEVSAPADRKKPLRQLVTLLMGRTR
ncbi:MAG TPA: polyprenyl synthetase family protein, partial [Flavobacteriales bacterium]|nr:polyprenyl synthetase family protein [Flavobacteriales bacterium]